MSFLVNNGKAELQLSYRLGHPEESHLPPQQDHHKPQVQPRRRKSQKRKARDNARAARYQAAQRAAISSSAAATSSSSTVPMISVLQSRYFCSTSTPSTSAPVVTSPAGLVSQVSITTTVTSHYSPLPRIMLWGSQQMSFHQATRLICQALAQLTSPWSAWTPTPLPPSLLGPCQPGGL